MKFTTQQVRDSVNEILNGFRTRQRVLVVSTFNQLPSELRESLAANSVRNWANIRTVQWRGCLYFIADRIASLDDLPESVLHETVIHFGTRHLIGREQRFAILDGVARDNPMELRRRGRAEYGNDFDPSNQAHRRRAAEEVLAYFAGEYLSKKSLPARLRRWVHRWLAAIHYGLRRFFGREKKFDVPFIRRFVQDMQANLRSGASLSGYEDLAPQAERNLPQTFSAAFRRWFGPSKVVDDTGEPLRVYHGNAHGDGTGIAEFDRMSSHTRYAKRALGMDTVGIWFSDESEGGSLYAGGGAGAVYPVYLSIRNPWRPKSFDEFLDRMHTTARRNPRTQSPRGRGSTEQLRAWLKANDYDGIVFPKNTFDGVYQQVWVALEPIQIKSAIGNNGEFDSNNADIAAERQAPIFFSALTRAAEHAKLKEGHAKQWTGTLQNSLGVKPDEIKWSGLERWIESLKRNATQQEVVDYLSANEIQIREAVKGGESSNQIHRTHDGLVVELTSLGYIPDSFDPESDVAIENKTGDRWIYDEHNGEWAGTRRETIPFSSVPLRVRKLANELVVIRRDMRDGANDIEDDETRYSSYTTPGGDNYRELLLTLPLPARNHGPPGTRATNPRL